MIFFYIRIDIKRCATDAESKILINDRFLTMIKSNNMWAALSCILIFSYLFSMLCLMNLRLLHDIATISDEFNDREVIEKLKLSKDSTALECATARNISLLQSSAPLHLHSSIYYFIFLFCTLS